MNKFLRKCLIISLSIITFTMVLNVLIVINSISSDYTLLKTNTNEWSFAGGYIETDGIIRDEVYHGLKYIGTDTIDINKITVELWSYNAFDYGEPELLSHSSIEASSGLVLTDGFEYAGACGRTDNVNVLESYFINKVELLIIVETDEKTSETIIDIPIRRK